MWQTALNTIGTAALAALVTVACVAIKSLGGAVETFIGKKAAAWEIKIGSDAYNHNMAVARGIWGAVEEDVRTNPELQKLVSKVEAKQQLFARKIQKAIPGLTDDEIVQFRQAVAGEVNKGREAIITPFTEQPMQVPVAVDGKASFPADSAAQAGAQGITGAI